jgi:hypothetical protein
MAIAIKSVPVLKKDAADRFNINVSKSNANKSTVKFAKQVAVSAKIIQKSKI